LLPVGSIGSLEIDCFGERNNPMEAIYKQFCDTVKTGVSAQDVIVVDDWGYGYGPYETYYGEHWGAGGIATYTFEEGSLVLDFVDTKTKRLIWRGSAKAEIDSVDSPEKSTEIIDKAVKEILKNYPPPSKK
jgi:hypothetical protein